MAIEVCDAEYQCGNCGHRVLKEIAPDRCPSCGTHAPFWTRRMV